MRRVFSVTVLASLIGCASPAGPASTPPMASSPTEPTPEPSEPPSDEDPIEEPATPEALTASIVAEPTPEASREAETAEESESSTDVPAKAAVKGSLDKEVVRRVVRRYIGDVQTCYDRGRKVDSELEGRVAIEFVIDERGKVPLAAVKASTLHNAEVESCLVEAVKGWKFPAPPDGKTVVVYPFELKLA